MHNPAVPAGHVDNSGAAEAARPTLTTMTIDAFAAPFEPLLTEQDMRDRITGLLAPAINPAQLWVLVLDELRRQTPLMMPIDDCPDLPDPAGLDALADLLTTALDENVDGAGSVIFVRERLGPDRVTADDRCWAAELAGACARAGVEVTGTFLLSPHRVLPLAP